MNNKSKTDDLTTPEARYKDILDNCIEVYWRTCNRFVFNYITPSIEDLSGYSVDEIIGKRLTKLISFSDFFNIAKMAFSSLKSQKTDDLIDYELSIIKKDKNELQVEISSKCLFDLQGKPIGYQGSIRNISQRKLLEKELLANVDKFKLIFEKSNVGKSLTTPDGTINVNKVFCDMLGYEKNELINKKWQDLTPKEEIPEIEAKLAPLLNGELDSTRFRKRYIHKFGFNICTDVSVAINRDANGNPLYFLTTIVDISEQVKAEKQLKKSNLLFNEAQAISKLGGWEFNIDTNEVFWTDEVFKIYGVPFDFNPNDITNDISFYSPEDRDRIREVFNNAVINGDPYEIEAKFVDANGINKYIRTAGRPLYDGNVIKKIVGYIIDITEQKKIELELVEAKQQAESMNKLKSNFLANMSHEMRTPMVGILGFAEILAKELKDKEQSDLASMIVSSSKRLMETINNLLDLSQIEFKNLKVNYSYVNIVNSIDRIAKPYKEDSKRKNLYFYVENKVHNLVSEFDEILFIRIIEHLLSNAVKYTDKGGITLLIDKIIENEQPFAIIKVKDTGIGIPQDYFNTIFQEFRQVSEGINRSFEGTGIGLAIVKNYVEQLGGEVYVESILGGGTEFTVKLPASILTKDSIISNLAAIEVLKHRVDSPLSENRKKVLVVDDDDATRFLIKKCIRHLCEIDIASSADQAINMAKNDRYEIILMDINLRKGKDGVQALQEIRTIESYENVPIVSITAYARESDKTEFLNSGFTHYLSKPFSRDEIVKLIEGIVDQINCGQN